MEEKIEKIVELVDTYQSMEQQELGGLLVDFHKQGVMLDDLKDSLTEAVKENIKVPEIEEIDLDDMKSFLAGLDKKVEDFRKEE